MVVIHLAGGINPGMVLMAKRWPPERFAAVADRLIEEWGACVFLVGGPGDQAVAAAVQRHMRHQPVDLTGQLSLGQLAALMEQASLFIGNDTGAMHLAVAVGRPTVAIFGPSDPRRYGPYTDQGIALWHPEACPRPLATQNWGERGEGRLSACPDCACIEAVSVQEVWEAAGRLLQGKRAELMADS